MKIDEIIGRQELIDRLRTVRLKGYSGMPYESCLIDVIPMQIQHITPCQNYVLRSNVDNVLHVHDFLVSKLESAFTLTNAYVLDVGQQLVPFLPPVVEHQVVDGVPQFILNDGMHRVYAARELGLSCINVVLIIGCDYPYYAYPVDGGWSAVEVLDQMVEGYTKKRYTDPDNYKALFRQFNDVFPGIQVQRPAIKDGQ